MPKRRGLTKDSGVTKGGVYFIQVEGFSGFRVSVFCFWLTCFKVPGSHWSLGWSLSWECVRLVRAADAGTGFRV